MHIEQSPTAWSRRLLIAAALIAGAAGAGAEALTVSAVGGELCGDCTQDGRVDVVDALRAAQDLLSTSGAMSKPISGRGRLACDVNGDRRIDMIDVMQIVHSSQRSAAETRSGAGASLCAFERLDLPAGATGVAYEVRLDESLAPPTATLTLTGSLPLGVTFQAAERRIVGVPLEAGLARAELEVRLDTGRSQYYALDLETYALPHAAELDYARDGDGALVVTRLVELGTAPGSTVQAIAATPRSWRSEDPSLLALLGSGEHLLALVGHRDAMPGGGGWTCWTVPLFALPGGEPIAGLAFAGESCYLLAASGALFRLDGRHGALEGLVALGTFGEFAGATSLAVRAVDGVVDTLVVTLRESSTVLSDRSLALGAPQVVLMPLAAVDAQRAPQPGPLGLEARFVRASGGAAFAAAFAASAPGAAPELYVRRQPDHLAFVSLADVETTIDLGARAALPPGFMPPVAASDDLVAVADATHLVYTSGSPERGGVERNGVWLLAMDGTYRHERLLGGFIDSRPAGSLAVGAATVGTGTSLFVCGNGAIYEVLGVRDSMTFRF